MKISVKVKTGSRIEGVTEENGVYLVRTKEPPHEGRANSAVIKLLSEYFHKPKSSLNILSGKSSKNKVIEIPE